MYNPVPTVATGDLWTASNHNTYIRDNFAAGVPHIFTTKGDLAVALGSQAAGRLGVGDNGDVLMAASAEALGMAWDRNLVFSGTNITHADWNGDGKSVGTTTIAVDTFSKGIVPATAKAVLASVSARWTAADDGNVIYLRPAGSSGNCVVARAHEANYFQDNIGIVPLVGGEFDVTIAGAGANAVYIGIWGYIL